MPIARKPVGFLVLSCVILVVYHECLSPLVSSSSSSTNALRECVVREGAYFGGHCPVAVRHEFVLGDRMHEVKDLMIPESLDWRNVDGKNYLSWSRNQHVPMYCGACWAFAVTSALSDRFNIHYHDRFPEIALSPQVLLNCDMEDNGCHGGDAPPAHEYIRTNGIPSETCAPYQATGHDEGAQCRLIDQCKTCEHDGACSSVGSYQNFFIEEYGDVVGEEQMKAELVRGPIVCGIEATESLLHNYTSGIYSEPSDFAINHDISVIGYGEENSVKYWIVRNSWGTYWGELGFFRIVRGAGTDNLGIETACAWATPQEPQPAPPSTPAHSGAASEKPRRVPCRTALRAIPSSASVSSSSLPSDIPAAWDWGNVKGNNLLTVTRNQHIPQYCGSCWSFATTSSVSDRFMIALSKKNDGLRPFPEVNLAPQVLINEYAGGSCQGGDPSEAFLYMKSTGIPDETCQPYQAKNDPFANKSLEICLNCDVISFLPKITMNCYGINKFPRYFVSDAGRIHGVNKMKEEIFRNGPISCGIDATDGLDAYTGGIYSESQWFPMINHEISIVGFGKDTDGTEFWNVRNSWGTYWGEKGYFRIKMYEDNLGIETQCLFATPKME